MARNEPRHASTRRREQGFDCDSVAAKRDLFDQLYRYVRSLPTEEELRIFVRDLSARYHVDIAEFCNELCMNWSELTTLAADPLVTIGAHTVNHVMLAKVPERMARSEMEMSRSVIEASLGKRPDSSVLSGRRQDLGRPARIPDRRASSASRPRSPRGRACCSRSIAII